MMAPSHAHLPVPTSHGQLGGPGDELQELAALSRVKLDQDRKQVLDGLAARGWIEWMVGPAWGGALFTMHYGMNRLWALTRTYLLCV
jgi:hypothetical protein